MQSWSCVTAAGMRVPCHSSRLSATSEMRSWAAYLNFHGQLCGNLWKTGILKLLARTVTQKKALTVALNQMKPRLLTRCVYYRQQLASLHLVLRIVYPERDVGDYKENRLCRCTAEQESSGQVAVEPHS